ncbi:glyoxalase/bleomycin resistance/extradiol dioxygenase family protein [Agrobacterium vitis]|uniref:Glyoxalase/bleomycin resistance/extradiol dioxygenase family protein n=1 Tax=Agrobacterium vitis TaxID=373 RepID=A0A368NVU8_AGRVI|nr:VOC family protein [Agrobacterium vitis]KAA3513650.1 glyoxalase/bleomycin resistance/extradiol dioxygenase family protein [Agrobacterium vitis]KAA3528231.1 glyoxalase/bleomycin resistance/extradiol dioxygenase family protein [Agrobacterium vitis]MCF1477729.1 glyoxalase/bleomycin resistance/extradiol dioxygenase family protein [Agrobacterium vitis]MUZ98611.1 glyoxalase/bleomycin resistance/extradiol dioxygenase family protein [Agrobacterium vitis]MVA30565.1 glyoxalase/bleomycin resistance/ex
MATSIEGILETSLYVDDLDAAERFYAGLLGLEVIVSQPGRHVFLRCGPGVLLLFNAVETVKPAEPGALPVPAHGAVGPGHACFRMDGAAMDGMASRLLSHGVAIEADFLWPNGARSIYFRDPAGNSLECAEARLWQIE